MVTELGKRLSSILRTASIPGSTTGTGRSGGRRRLGLGFAVWGILPVLAMTGCETNDPCALRTAACIDVALIGARTDTMGAPIAYRDLSIKICSGPSVSSAPCSEGQAPPSCASELVTTPEPQTLTAVAAYSANVQGLVSFQLPSAFNELPDVPPTEVDSLGAAERKARLLMLRNTDPRAVRILVTQPQTSGAVTVWDSRCEEDLFSNDEWSKLKYYRVGKNEYRSVFAQLRKAQTSTP